MADIRDSKPVENENNPGLLEGFSQEDLAAIENGRRMLIAGCEIAGFAILTAAAELDMPPLLRIIAMSTGATLGITGTRLIKVAS